MSAVKPDSPERNWPTSPIKPAATATESKIKRASQDILKNVLIQDIVTRTIKALKQNTLTEGRKVLLEEMQKNAQQLEVDVMRLGDITVGSRHIPIEESPQKMMLSLSIALVEHAESVNPALTDTVCDLSDELLYATVQTWRNLVLASCENALTPYREDWGPSNTGTTSSTSFQLEKRGLKQLVGLEPPTTLRVSCTNNRTFVRLDDTPGSFKVAIKSDCIFDLKTKNVTFELSYTIDGKTKRCKTDNPFDENSLNYK